ncbi:MAG: CvpA family protein [Alistipes sp.]|nr:CvpA family protein [Alistipes sp.]
MNVFDIIVYIALAWAVFNGWRRGFLLQLVSFVAVIAGLMLAAKYGAYVGSVMGLDSSTAAIVGFLVIFLASLVAITIVGHLLRAVLRFSGLGVADVLLGILFSVVKIGLVVGVLFSWFAAINRDYTWVEKQTIEQSRWFSPVVRITDTIMPYFEEQLGNIVNR